MKIILNASNLKVGGAIQVALATLQELRNHPDDEFYVFLSPAFSELIDKEVIVGQNVRIFWVDFPKRVTLFGKVRQLDILEREIGADCVFSIFGPTYWRPRAPHLAGFAQGYYLYSDLPFFNSMRWTSKFRLFILKQYHKVILRKHIDEFVVETQDVRTRFAEFLGLSKDKIHVASNTFSSYFRDFKSESRGKHRKTFRLLTVAYPYPHKNLLVLKSVSDILSSSGVSFRFYITVPESYYRKHFSGYEDSIKNLGPIPNSECPVAYDDCDAMILPSLVECFSASYPEAMKMQRPILTSQYSFAKTVCGDAAIYFDPLSASDIATKIIMLCSDKDLYDSLVQAGNERVGLFLTPEERCAKYISLLYEMGGCNV